MFACLGEFTPDVWAHSLKRLNAFVNIFIHLKKSKGIFSRRVGNFTLAFWIPVWTFAGCSSSLRLLIVSSKFSWLSHSQQMCFFDLTHGHNFVYLHNGNVQPNAYCEHTHSNLDTASTTQVKQVHRILCTFRALRLHDAPQWGRQKGQCVWKPVVVFFHVSL